MNALSELITPASCRAIGGCCLEILRQGGSGTVGLVELVGNVADKPLLTVPVIIAGAGLFRYYAKKYLTASGQARNYKSTATMMENENKHEAAAEQDAGIHEFWRRSINAIDDAQGQR